MRIRVLGQFIHTQVFVLATVEALLFALCPYVAYALRFMREPAYHMVATQDMLPTALVFCVAVSLSFFAFGLYTTRQRARLRGLSLRILMAVCAAMAALAVTFYVAPQLLFGRGIMAISGMTAVVASVLSRFVFGRSIDTEILKRRVLLYGHCARLLVFDKLRRRSDRRGFSIVGILAEDSELVTAKFPGNRFLKGDTDLLTLCRKLDVDEVVIALEDRRGCQRQDELLNCRLAGIGVVDIVSFLERETGRIHLEALNPSWMIFNEGFRRDAVRQFSARMLDFFASAVLVALALPVMLLTMLAIWIEDGRHGGGVFYRQERVGLEGRVFSLLKFRSMRVDAEASGKPQWAQKNDVRVTRVGSFIRRTRIDELPQLLNVLRGQMSFVGPRPERPHFVDELQARIPYYGYRHSVKPGITGWAQLCYPYGASEQDAIAKLQYDLYYVKNNSLLLDLGILVQTAEVVFMGKGR
jgi:sugar transferase (PEP-CTERM system associated)